jgi:phosphocarrier protein
MEMKSMERTFKVTDEDGIHARPATALVNTANKFKSEVFAEAKGRKVTMKSILGVLSFGLEAGDTIKFIASGEDEAEVISALEEVFVKEGLGVVHE